MPEAERDGRDIDIETRRQHGRLEREREAMLFSNYFSANFLLYSSNNIPNFSDIFVILFMLIG